MKLLYNMGKPVLLDIKKNGEQVFYGRVKIEDVASVNTDISRMRAYEDPENKQFVVKIEV